MGKSLALPSQGETNSPKQNETTADTDRHNASSNRADASKVEPSDTETAKPLAPPPRPNQQNGNTPDYFTTQSGGSLSMEPNPFEQSFGGAPETPGGTKLPSVASLTSPSSLLPGGGTTPFNWGGGSLRTGPLSPAMLSGPAGDYYADTHLRGGFPTPNESSLRTGLTPGGSGSMFPASSPSSQALFAQLQNGSATPSTLDFHRTAINAAVAKRDQQAHQSGQQHIAPPTSQPSITSQPQEHPSITSAPAPVPAVKAESKLASGQYDPHDKDAANGLYLLAQGGNGTQAQASFAVPPPPLQAAVIKHTAVPVPISVSASVAAMQPAQTPVAPPQDNRQRAPAHNGVSSMNGSSSHAAPTTMGNGSGGFGHGASESGSPGSEKSETPRFNGRGRGKRNSTSDAGAAANGRRKAQEMATKNSPPSKRAKTNGSPSSMEDEDGYSDDEEDKDGQPKQKMTEDEKRKNFLERNRVAALKCRQRKKQWLASLQSKVELFTSENESLTTQITQLREEIVHLKTLLLAHKDCPITQQQGMHGAFVQQSMEPYNGGQLNPYSMAATISNQQAISAQVDQRRFS
ncbi:bzip transcription factor [Grosmannia clavigera kw1407]|uniref:Bzip transcription factor n=1 Tax=Grosmannia clavigera (strain kw1407 / UAMH 11150) TaxID=655863 RepID=F0XE79_GROCL|nr:bzip transcription factor [Grosmannia clavigera kw1407]EFX03755.1 bzip transcription factor [Grosmannia clavigera kw1407]